LEINCNMEFENDQNLIKSLRGDRKEMLAALTWLKSNAKWKEVVSINIAKLNMDQSLKEDIFIECLTNFTINIRKGTFKGESQLLTYYSSICRYNLLTRLSKKATKSKHIITMENEKIVASEKVDQKKLTETTRQISIKETLTQLINQLKEECKSILGFVILGYSMQEIGEILGFKTQTIKNKAGNCRASLRERALNNPRLMKEIKSLI